MINNLKIITRFSYIYKTKIESELTGVEKYRIRKKIQYDTLCTLLTLSVLLIPVSLLISYSEQISPQIRSICHTIYLFIPVIILICGIFALFAYKISKDFRKKIKPQLFKTLLSSFGDFKQSNTEIVSLRELKKMGIFPNGRVKKDIDNTTGDYKKNTVSFIDTKIINNNNVKSTSPTVIFSGLIIRIELNKKFEGVTIGAQKTSITKSIDKIDNPSNKSTDTDYVLDGINEPFNPSEDTDDLKQVPSKFIKPVNGKLAVVIIDDDAKNVHNEELNKVETHDYKFDKIYNIYSNNEFESIRFITSNFVENIINIQTAFNISSVNFALTDKYIYLFLDTDSMFSELKLFQRPMEDDNYFEDIRIDRSLYNEDIYYNIYMQLSSIFSFIDTIGL